MTEKALTELARKLFDLRYTGQVVPLVKAAIGDESDPDYWRPQLRWCGRKAFGYYPVVGITTLPIHSAPWLK